MSTIYVVKPKSGALSRVIEAKSAAAVMKHIYAETNLPPTPASKADLLAAMESGAKVERASEAD